MKLTKIITLANASVQLDLRAMERSLRATGCKLPLWVIPFDEVRDMELPSGAEWMDRPEFFDFVNSMGGLGHHRKYVVLTESQYQLMDVDAIFLKDPAVALEPLEGFVATCIQWSRPEHAVTPSTEQVLRRRRSMWQLQVFNCGQFASSIQLFSETELKLKLADQSARALFWRRDLPWEQPAVNHLVHLKSPPYTCLTLPPHNMESTWAGDYPGEYESYWEDESRRPYLMHWAGNAWDVDRPINKLFLDYLTREEQAQWREKQRIRMAEARARYVKSLSKARRMLYYAKQAARSIGIAPVKSARANS